MNKVLAVTTAVIATTLGPIQFKNHNYALAAPSSQPSKSERAMSRIENSLKQIESQLKKVRPDTSENTLNGIQKKIDRSRKWLSALPEDTAGHGQISGDLDVLEANLNKHQSNSKMAASKRAGDVLKMKERASQETSEEHYQFMVNAERLSSAMEFMDFNHPHMDRKDSITQEYKHYASQYPIAFEKVQELMTFFEGMDDRDVREIFNPLTAQMVRSGAEQYILAQSKLDDFGKNALEVAADKITLAGKNVRHAIDDGRAADLLEDKSISDALNYLENVKTIYQARPDVDAKTLKDYKGLQKRADLEINDTMLEAFNIIVAKNPPVANGFLGSDRDAVEKMVRYRWNEAYPDDEILQVRITQTDWVRRREPGWRNGYLIMFDYSIVTPYVVVKEKEGLASQWGMVAEKDHTLEDEISISFGRLRSEKLDPLYTVLQSNLD